MMNTRSALISLAVLLNTLIWLGLRSRPHISAENGPMENFQLACLSLSCLLWLASGFVAQEIGVKHFLFCLALFNLSFIVLELDTRGFDAPLLNMIMNEKKGRIRDAGLAGIWLLMAIAFVPNRKEGWAVFLNWLKSASGIVLLLSGGFWILSGFFDKSVLVRKAVYMEELMEVNATLLMLISAGLFIRGKKLFPPRRPS
jgi:hypothetical protein